MKAILLTGNTYKIRREIRALKGKWDYDQKGWIISTDYTNHINNLRDKYNLTSVEIEVNEDYFRPFTPDELRTYRQNKANRKAEKLLKIAERKQKEAEILGKEVKPYMEDVAFVTQPNINSSAGRSFKRFREKINNKIDKEFALMNEAEALKEKAENIVSNVVVKGDAERKRQAERDANDLIIKKGSRIFSYGYGCEGTVIGIYKKSYKVKFDRGFTGITDKAHCKLI